MQRAAFRLYIIVADSDNGFDNDSEANFFVIKILQCLTTEHPYLE